MILNKNKRINILITCVGGQYAYSLVNCLRLSNKFNVKIIGIDKKIDVEDWFLDKFFCVNEYLEKDYILSVKNICIKEKINFIIPGSENETQIYSKNSNIFTDLKIILPLSKYAVVKLLSDKLKFYNFLKKNNLNFVKFLEFNNLLELKKILQNLNYPNKKILLKPRLSSGSKGIFILDEKSTKIINLLENRLCMQLSYRLLIKYVKANKFNLQNYIAMEFIDGKFYDVDCFSRKGELIYCIPRERKYINPFSPINTGCIITSNDKIIKYVKKIVNKLKIDGISDFDIIVYKNKAIAIDSSSRLSGSVASSLPAKINIPELIIDNYFNSNISKIKIKKIHVKPVIKFISK